MRLAPIKDRLIAQVPAFATVAGAAALALALKQGQFNHQAYVFTSKIGAGNNGLVNAVSQRVQHEITVAYWASDVSDSTGEAVMEDIEDLRDSVITALLGWTPDGLMVPFLYRDGAVMQFNFGRVLWGDRFVIDTYLRQA